MLVQLVRPLVRTQVQMLAQAQSASGKLVGMVSQWLGYLGIHAEVTQLQTTGNRIQVSLCVGKPEQCTEAEWQQILDNLNRDVDTTPAADTLTYAAMPPTQQGKVQRLLAAILHASGQDPLADWPTLRPRLVALGIEEPMLAGIHSALKVPMPVELLVEHLEPEVAAFVLAKAIHIALLDQQISQAEDTALKALLNAVDSGAGTRSEAAAEGLANREVVA
ncbi:hypothetical protein PGN35_028175 [Nodosilinea sp. PGN35]|uniref:hypothetical protein n=1 Tax=Nodosilinea sp. PGN35 TaxID=3020489 RepID=UPI0023B30750|nr:hypothetical protein [Nodosilinea sp. TSF1-S3]MDF0365316.1 hypothetical protein [Nodosilinea sp. TSF1-S3]